MSNDINRLTIEDLLQRLELLHIEQAQVLAELRKRTLREETSSTSEPPYYDTVSSTGDNSKSEQTSSIGSAERYNNTFRPRIGDTVRILNPRKDQKDTGVIQEFCKDGKPRVFVGEGLRYVDRLTKNLVCTKRYFPRHYK